MSRRTALRGITAAAALTALGGCSSKDGEGSSSDHPIAIRITDDHEVATGHDARVLIRWGDEVLPGAGEQTNFSALDPASQAGRFGYNNDYVAYSPLPRGSASSRHGLLCVNHEYTDAEMMWPGIPNSAACAKSVDAQQTDVELMAHGLSVVEIKRTDDAWEVVHGSRHARRITGHTPFDVRGPARGNPRMKTSQDPAGTTVAGTFGNCAGGMTPWGTVLSAEENFQDYFSGDPKAQEDAADLARYGFGKPYFGFGRFHDRFNLDAEPNEANRFGWVVEVDPYDSTKPPRKRTALGRFRHEGASCIVNGDGRLVVYSGDDQRFEYLYRYVSNGMVSEDPAANDTLLDEGVLSVARFSDDGQVTWLPLVQGLGPLTKANGFADQGDVVIRCRQAADLLGATPLDRPEDIEVDPKNGHVFVVLTNNNQRTAERTDAVNPRANNVHGHVIELLPPTDGQHAADIMGWNIFLRGGEGAASDLHCPDNAAFDTLGRLWIATDQGGDQEGNGVADGMWVTDVTGPHRARPRFFFACPRGAEVCGPMFTPDSSTLFVSVQHPGSGKHPSGAPATFENPTNRWPDNLPDRPPRSAIVAITKRGGGVIGT